ncbi:glycosyltransferase family protein [Brachybacterium muris]|uniref:glycosyltransferase family protein n=1 Tax=Brachybacterium muris TaxID=219301 RepID=UPI0022287BD2|nr:glycosyltransferase [Brachybacterium muris]MCT1654571.1 glycosyl transferase [Brachybacterium muris]
MDISIVLYSHDSVGLGHARRNRALAFALAAHLPALVGGTVRGLLIAGHPDAGRDPLPEGWDWLVLPGMTRSSDGKGFRPRRLDMDGERLRDLRSATIDAALAAFDPDLLIADRHPFGIDGELRPVLANVRARGTRTVLGLREVLDTPRVAAAEWDALGGAEQVAELLDAVWVYGDHHVYDPRLTGELPGPLARLAITTGYLGHGRPAGRPSRGRTSPKPPPPYVLTVLGGGSDGGELARIAARATLPEGHRHLLITGPQMSDADLQEVREIAAHSGDATTVVHSAPDVPELIAEAVSVVCMGGYNTLAEVMATSTPALVVPRARRRQEQPRRAAALAALGAVETLDAADLTPQDITAWWERSVTTRTDRTGIDLDGLSVVPHLAARLLNSSVRAAPEVTSHAV